MTPKANLKLRRVSVSVLIGVGAVSAVLGGILLLVSICLIIGAAKVSDTFTLLSILWSFPKKERKLGQQYETETGHMFPWDRRFLFKTPIKFYKGSHQQDNVLSAQIVDFCLRPSAKQPCCRCAAWEGTMRGSYERMDVSWPTEQLTFVSKRILANQLRHWSQAIPGWLNFWQRVIKEWQENDIHANLSRVSRQREGCEYVCVVVEHHVTRLRKRVCFL